MQEVVWGNWFSYGDSNILQLDNGKVTQITGTNGSGKSSIPVIIGEILYGKNALGKTKAKLSNRYRPGEPIWGNILFQKDNDSYAVEYNRKSTLKLSLAKNGADISSHTASDTYKTLLDILGYDFKTFWGLIYQSSKEGLEFLTATDTNRKKFLIKLFNLDVYLHIHELFKTISTQKNTEIQVIKGKISTIEEWIKKNESEDLTIKVPNPIPIIDNKDIDEIGNLKAELGNIREDNKKINDNNTLKQILSNLDTSILTEDIPTPRDISKLQAECQTFRTYIAENNREISIIESSIKHIQGLEGICPTCSQEIDEEFQEKLLSDKEEELNILKNANIKNNDMYETLSELRTEAAELMSKKAKQEQVEKELSTLLSKIDQTLPAEVKVDSEIQDKIDILSEKLSSVQNDIREISTANLKIEAHNSKVIVIREQLNEYKNTFNTLLKESEESENENTKLGIIKKAFSTNGLLSYKLEHLSKDLEDQINIYLAELSKGRFQLNFSIAGEKLNVEIIDDGRSITIEELSAGELARVNTSTLLAIRKLMAAISSAKINILFLDEITGVLDDEGKEALIDILSSETELNTFLVSHEFTHPLIPQVNIIKENKISRIEE
jgi:DNA repair exonuclease SbcCD ATPase subunit